MNKAKLISKPPTKTVTRRNKRVIRPLTQTPFFAALRGVDKSQLPIHKEV